MYGRDVVVLISGWGSSGNEWSLSPIKGVLRECGYKVVVFKNCDNGFGSIEHNAEQLARFTDEIWEQSPNSVHLIGHSMGGLVAVLSEEYVANRCASSVTTIGTPHKGAASARLASWSDSAKEMSNVDGWIDVFNNAHWLSPLHSIACRFDAVVPGSRAISKYSTHTNTVNHGHATVLFSRRVAKMIVKYLTVMQNSATITGNIYGMGRGVL